jgi:hypothetical protein
MIGVKMSKNSIENKHWVWTNEQIRDISRECRDYLLDYAKEDVRLCIENNGIHDPICQQMAEDVNDMEEYWLGD